MDPPILIDEDGVPTLVLLPGGGSPGAAAAALGAAALLAVLLPALPSALFLLLFWLVGAPAAILYLIVGAWAAAAGIVFVTGLSALHPVHRIGFTGRSLRVTRLLRTSTLPADALQWVTVRDNRVPAPPGVPGPDVSAGVDVELELTNGWRGSRALVDTDAAALTARLRALAPGAAVELLTSWTPAEPPGG